MNIDVDSFNEELHDLDEVVINKYNDITPGIYYNHRVLTLEGRINMSQIAGIMKVSSESKEFKSVIREIKEEYTNELSSKTKELVIGYIPVGAVIVTKTNKKWLYLGNSWSIHNHCSKKLKSGTLFVSMEHIDTNKSLTENLNNIIKNCLNTKDMLKYFKFSQPKAISIDDSYSVTEEDIREFITTGYIGIINNKDCFCLLLNYANSHYYDIYKDIKGLYMYTYSCSQTISEISVHYDSLNRAIKVDKFNDKITK